MCLIRTPGAQVSLRSIVGKSELDDLLSHREQLIQGLESMIDSPAVEWGVTIDRERRARVINADAELQASKKLAVAAAKNSTLVLPIPVELLRFLEKGAR